MGASITGGDRPSTTITGCRVDAPQTIQKCAVPLVAVSSVLRRLHALQAGQTLVWGRDPTSSAHFTPLPLAKLKERGGDS